MLWITSSGAMVKTPACRLIIENGLEPGSLPTSVISETQLPKLYVVGSIPIARSKQIKGLAFARPFFMSHMLQNALIAFRDYNG